MVRVFDNRVERLQLGHCEVMALGDLAQRIAGFNRVDGGHYVVVLVIQRCSSLASFWPATDTRPGACCAQEFGRDHKAESKKVSAGNALLFVRNCRCCGDVMSRASPQSFFPVNL
ncbi:hypothetical protein D3C77_651560 [compost metagenome]